MPSEMCRHASPFWSSISQSTVRGTEWVLGDWKGSLDEFKENHSQMSARLTHRALKWHLCHDKSLHNYIKLISKWNSSQSKLRFDSSQAPHHWAGFVFFFSYNSACPYLKMWPWIKPMEWCISTKIKIEITPFKVDQDPYKTYLEKCDACLLFSNTNRIFRFIQLGDKVVKRLLLYLHCAPWVIHKTTLLDKE